MKLTKIHIVNYILFTEAWINLGIARLLVLILPFKIIHALIGKPITLSNNHVNQKLLYKNNNIGKAIQRASKRCFWRAKCLEQAIAASSMLKIRRKSYTFFMGIMINKNQNFSSHAWLISEEEIITGNNTNLSSFTIITILQN